MKKIALYALAATAAASVATTPAHASLKVCSTTNPLYIDYGCYSQAHGQFCDVHIRHDCININLPGGNG